MDSYLNRFEKFAESQKADKTTWALSLSALLRGRAFYSMMSKDDVNDYEKLKSALLKRYQLTADGFRIRFRTSYPEQGESPVQFITRLENYLVRWIEMAEIRRPMTASRNCSWRNNICDHVRRKCQCTFEKESRKH